MDIPLFISVVFGFLGIIACQLVGLRQQSRIEASLKRLERIEASLSRIEASNERIEASLKRIETGIVETRQVQQEIRMDTAVLADRVPRDFGTRAQGGRGS